ncbi:MAG: alcohol dehydrogenase catalytic domain-containing protein [Thermaerobacterales bacterium]
MDAALAAGRIPPTMQAAYLLEPGRVSLRTVPVPRIGPGEALLRLKVCGLCASDAIDWYVAQKAPFVFGHEPAGEIVKVGAGVAGFSPGDRVFVHHHAPCLNCRACQSGDVVHCSTWRRSALDPGGLAEFIRIPAENLSADTLRLPPDLSFEAGAMIEPVACAVKALQRGALASGLDVMIMGLGFMGQVLGYLCRGWEPGRRSQGQLLGADRIAARLERAASGWADGVIDIDQGAAADFARAATGGRGVDLAIVTPPSQQALHDAIRSTRSGGRVVLYAPTPPGEGVPVDLNGVFFREISLIPSYSAGPAETRKAMHYVSEGIVPVDNLITHRLPLKQIEKAYSLIKDAQRALKVVVIVDV